MGKPLTRNHERVPGAYYISKPDWIDAPAEVVFDFDYKGIPIQMYQWKSEAFEQKE